MPNKKEPPKAPLTYESAFSELETITKRLEEDPACLESLLKDFERGQELVSFCQNTLQSTRKQLELIEAKIHSPKSSDFVTDQSEPDTNQNINPSYDDVRLI